MARVHIILATYNGEKYIREQLDSIINNTFKDISIEICDDGSIDDTRKIVREYCEEYDFISLHENEKNLGYVGNFLAGIKRCESPYFMLCDQDDIWHKDKIEKTLKCMKTLEDGTKKPRLIFSNAMNYESETGKELGPFHESSHLDTSKLDEAHLFMENKVIGCTVMCNQMVKDYVEYSEHIRVHDWWLALICSHFGEICYLSETTLHYRQHSGNMIGGSGFSQYVKSRIANLSKQREVLKKTVQQGKQFYEEFQRQMTEEQKEIAFHFATLYEKNWLQRRYAIMKYGFWKTGITRNAMLFLII